MTALATRKDRQRKEFAGVHHDAAEWLEQCPALAIYWADLDLYMKARIRRQLAHKGASAKMACRYMNVPWPVRKIDARACQPHYWESFRVLKAVPAIALANIVPTGLAAQKRWLTRLRRLGPFLWIARVRRSGGNLAPAIDLPRLVAIVADAPTNADLDDTLDYLLRATGTVHTRTTYASLVRARNAWHESLSLEQSTDDRVVRSLGGLPEKFTHGTLTLTALRTQAEFIEEGRAMKHCVASYWHDAIDGKIVIVSAREGERRRGTLEFHRQDGRWSCVQARSQCNRKVSEAVRLAAAAYAQAAA